MKRIITATLLFLGLINGLIAQNLEKKIPNDVDIIITSNAKNLFELITISDIDTNFLGEMILKDVNRGKDEQRTSIEDLGIDVKSNAYYFSKHINNIGFHSFFVELKNKKQFEANFSERKLEKIETEKGYSYIKGYSNITIWNDNYLLLIKGKTSMEEKGFESVKDYAFAVLENKMSTSISTNKNFQKAKKRNSVATVWVRDYGNLMTELAYSLRKFVFSSYGFNGKDLIGVDEITANLYFEKDNANMKVDVSVDDELKDAFKKMYNKKMSTNLLKNLNSKEILAFFSLSVNSEEVLLQYPRLVKKMYGMMLPGKEEEIEFGTDLFSLIIDEKAIGDLVTGDVLLVLNDFSKKEVEYTTYKYDEEYKRTEVVETKEETVPDITFMIGTKEEALLNKLFQIGKKYKVLDADKNIYKFTKTSNNIPFGIYVLVKNNVLYFTTSEEGALNIYNSTKDYKSSEHSKIIRKNSLVTYFNIHKTMGEFSDLSFKKPEKKAFDFGYKNLKDVYLKVSKVKGNKISSELRLNTSGNQENSLKLLLSFFNYMN